MNTLNINKLMAFREVDDHVLTVAELDRRYHIAPSGTLTYFGLVEESVSYLKATGRCLRADHRSVVDGLLAALYNGYADELTFQLVLEPIQPAEPYSFAAAHMALIETLAEELRAYQVEARAFGKRLNVILRFGSEMNDVGGTAYAQNPSDFISVFRSVRTIVLEFGTKALFPFSPALRADIDISKIEQYWPGADYVDLVGATWYVHGEEQRKLGFRKMSDYFSQYAGFSKPLSLDEFGGAEGTGEDYFDNDCMLRLMFRHVEALSEAGLRFEFGTIFLDEKQYGTDATLRFLR